MTVEEAKEAINTGIREYGKLVMQSWGNTLYYEWNGNVFPIVPHRRMKNLRIVKTTLLWGMVGHK